MPEFIWRPWSRARYGPQCGAEPPWRLPDAGPCCVRSRPAGGHLGETEGWHADGRGFIWNDELGRWQWMGPPIGPEEYDVARWGHYREPLGGPIFEEQA